MSLKTMSNLFPHICSLFLSRSVNSQAFYHACPPTLQSPQTKTPTPHTPPRRQSRGLRLPLPLPSAQSVRLSSVPSFCFISVNFLSSHPLRLSQDCKENPPGLCPFPNLSLADFGHMLPASFSNWSRGDVGCGLGLSFPLRVSKPFGVTEHALCRQRPPVRSTACWPADSWAATGR